MMDDEMKAMWIENYRNPQVDFTPKCSRYGDVRWSGFFTTGHSSGGTTYVMLGADSNSRVRTDSKGVLEVRHNVERKHWEVVVNGVVVDRVDYKTDAQRIAEALCR